MPIKWKHNYTLGSLVGAYIQLFIRKNRPTFRRLLIVSVDFNIMIISLVHYIVTDFIIQNDNHSKHKVLTSYKFKVLAIYKYIIQTSYKQ